MEQTTIREIRETMESIRTSFIPRAEANTLNPRDAAFLSEIVGDLKKEIAEEAGRNESVKEIYGYLARMQGLLDDPEPTGARQIAGLEAAISRDMDEMEKIVHIANALQLDAHGIQPLLEQIRQKQEEVMRSFQQAVDIDLKLYGKLSELTERGMEAFHFAVTPEGKVTAAQQVPKESGKWAEPRREQRQERREPEREYLNLLPMGTGQFKETTEFLKRNGGRYDPERKSWYMPAGKIPYQELAAHRVEPAGGREKKSVLSRLGENQEKAGREGHQEVKGRTAAER